MRRTLLGAPLFALGAGLLAGCNGGPEEVEIVEPARNGFVREGEPIVVRVLAERHDEVRLELDGEVVAPAAERDGGEFVTELVAAAPGRHRLVAEVPGVPGAADVRDVFVARAPHAPVDGFGFARGASHVITLSDARPSGGGLYAGRLTVVGIVETSGGFVRELTGDGVFAEVSDGGLLAWTDGWDGAAGTLHLAGLDGPEIATFEDARDASFGKDGVTLGVLDEGVVVRTADGEVRRVVPSSRAFVFAGPAGDLVSFDGEADGTGRRTASFATAPDYDLVTVLASPVFPLIASNPVRRESALIEWHEPETPRGSLVLFDYASASVERPFDRVVALTFSRDGAWLVALVDVPEGTLTGSVGLLSRSAPGVPMVHGGDFKKVSFDRGTTRLFALEDTAIGAVHRAWLDSPAPDFEVIATGVQEMYALPGDRMLLLLDGGDLAIVQPDDGIVELGTAAGDGTLSVSPDGEHLVFTAAGAGGAIVARRVDLASGHRGDLGTLEARRPVALAGGAVAWAEPAVVGGGEVLWMLPAFPGSFGGPRVVSASLETTGIFPVAPDGGAFAAVLGGRAVCVRAGGTVKDLGVPDPVRPTPFFLEDGGVARFGIDRGDERRVLFLQRCD